MTIYQLIVLMVLSAFTIISGYVLIRMYRQDKDHEYNLRQLSIVEQAVKRIMQEAMQSEDDIAMNEATVVINAAIDTYNESLRGTSASRMKLEHFRGFNGFSNRDAGSSARQKPEGQEHRSSSRNRMDGDR